MKIMLEIGQKAPEFTLSDQDGKNHNLSDYNGKWVVIYFYPKDMTPGCTKEACAMRDAEPDFSKLEAIVFGVSKDSESSHKKFEEKHNLNFSLLADPEMEMIKAYEALGEKSMFGKKYMGILRISYLIDPEGNIAKVYKKVKPAEHAKEIVKDIEELKNRA